MAPYTIPKNLGKVKLAVGLGNLWMVWNGKDEFRIPCRSRKQAEEVVKIINEKRHNGEIEVLMG